MSMTVTPRSHLVLDQRARGPRRRATTTSAAISRWQRPTQVLQVAHRAGRGRDQVHVDAEPLAEHAARIADAAAAVDRVADRDRVDQVAVGVAARAGWPWSQHAAQVAVADLVAGDRDLDADGLRGGMAAATR